ncbi:MAG TPA: hypothetical protein VGI70_03105 [Polyangiales bacterium]|jgi:hypothetical protein
MTSDDARELFSLAYDLQLSAAEQQSFDAALVRDPELADEYAGFCATFAAISGERASDPATPNLLPSIQRRLRNASGGRYYGDRFAERSGVGRFQPWMLLLGLALLIAILLLCMIASEAATP